MLSDVLCCSLMLLDVLWCYLVVYDVTCCGLMLLGVILCSEVLPGDLNNLRVLNLGVGAGGCIHVILML